MQRETFAIISVVAREKEGVTIEVPLSDHPVEEKRDLRITVSVASEAASA